MSQEFPHREAKLSNRISSAEFFPTMEKTHTHIYIYTSCQVACESQPERKRGHRNPSPTKMPRRHSIAVEATGQICYTSTASAAHVRPGDCRQKVHGTLVIRAFSISSQHCPHASFRSDMAATSAPLGVNFGQEGPNLALTHLTWAQFEASICSS